MSQYFRALLVPRGLPGSGKFAGMWDADHVTVAGGNTTVLLDQSGHGNNLPAGTGGTLVPVAAPTTVAGKLVLQPVGTSNFRLGSFPGLPADNDICLISVGRPDGNGGDIAIQVDDPAGNIGIGVALSNIVSGVDRFGAYLADFEFDLNANEAVDHSNRHLYIVQRNGTVLRLYRDGAPMLPIFSTVPHAGSTRVSVLGSSHLLSGDWRSSILSTSLTKKELEDLVAAICSAEGITSLNPAAIYNEDDNFGVGATIDTTGARRGSAVPWTARDLGSVTNAQAGGTLSLTLPQEATTIFRGYTQPFSGSGVRIYRAKIVPANLGTVNGHHAAIMIFDDVADHRVTTLEVGYDSATGNRHVGTRSYFLGSPWSEAAWMQYYVGGFTSGDWSQEWTLWIASQGSSTTTYMWYQIGSGPLQMLTDRNWFSTPSLVGIGVTSQNAGGGNTVADFTDFAREF